MAELQSKREILQQTRSGLCVGSKAPLFALMGTSKKAGQVNERIKYHLDDYRGQPVLLVFFSAAFTPT